MYTIANLRREYFQHLNDKIVAKGENHKGSLIKTYHFKILCWSRPNAYTTVHGSQNSSHQLSKWRQNCNNTCTTVYYMATLKEKNQSNSTFEYGPFIESLIGEENDETNTPTKKQINKQTNNESNKGNYIDSWRSLSHYRNQFFVGQSRCELFKWSILKTHQSHTIQSGKKKMQQTS